MLARLKFEISGLVKEILDQVDQLVFQSHDKTFLDPAMGGGQFIFETIKRLKEQGHSYGSIKSRVFGYESNILYVNYVKERYLREFGEEIPATLNVGGLKELETLKMKFDLVMGNPPYQIPISRTGSKHIYQEFVKKACELGTNILFIIPDNWMIQSNKLGTSVRFMLEQAGLKSITINPFDQFGSAIVETCWIYCEKGYEGEVSLSKDGKTYFRNRNKPFIPTDDTGAKIIDKVKESVSENWKVIHPNPSKSAFFVGPAYRSFGVFTIEPIHVFSNEKCNGRVGLIECGSKEEAEKILPFYKTYFESKLMRYVLLITRTSYALDSPQLSYIPKMPMNRTWTDEELYAHFGLTGEEVQYIEEQVK